MEQFPGTNAIIYPQEIWDGFSHRQVEHNLPPKDNSRIVTGPSA
jgi:hypothetical protein